MDRRVPEDQSDVNRAMLDDADASDFDPPDRERVYRNYLESVALSIAVAAISPPAIAGDIYKCQDPAGKIEFRDHPCDAGQKAQKIDITPNSVGTMTLEEVRAKTAELKAKQQARQDAENKANADAYAAQVRVSQDAIDLQQAIRDSGSNTPQTQFYNGYLAGQQLRPPATPSPPPPPPKAPAMPGAPPKSPSGG
jgi:hypothetical protein